MGPWRGHRGVLAVAGAGLTAAAAVALVITTTGPSPAVPSALPSSAAPSVPTASSAARPPTTAAPLDAHAFLLGSANVAAQSPVTTGSYWYVKERDLTETWPQNKASDYKPYYASTQETWTGATRTRTIVSEDLQFNFATPADKAKWQADGSPKLFGPSGTYGDHGPVTNDYNFGADAQSDIYALSMTDARNLPTSAAGLGALLHRKFSGLSADQRSVGLGETLGTSLTYSNGARSRFPARSSPPSRRPTTSCWPHCRASQSLRMSLTRWAGPAWTSTQALKTT